MSGVFDLTDKIAVVTGAGRGLGAEMAKALDAAGARVTLADRSPEPLERVATIIRDAGGHADCAPCDITRADDVQALVEGVLARNGRIDILVNNAGINSWAPLTDVTDSDWHRMLDTHMTGPFLACRAVLPGMIAQGGGKIVNTVSVAAQLGRSNVVPYSAAKGGLAMMTRGLAAEVAGKNIQVNGIGPGYFLTEMNRQIMDDQAAYEARVARIPAGRWGDPDELHGTIVFLASRASDYVSGQVIFVDGGLSTSF